MNEQAAVWSHTSQKRKRSCLHSCPAPPAPTCMHFASCTARALPHQSLCALPHKPRPHGNWLTVGSWREDHCTLRKLMLSLLWASFSKLFLYSGAGVGNTQLSTASQLPFPPKQGADCSGHLWPPTRLGPHPALGAASDLPGRWSRTQ